MPMPQIGGRAPGFKLEDQRGEIVKLSDLRGRPVVLYFYPKDDTTGCTQEACDFRDGLAAFEGAGAVVLGISPDGRSSHERFAAKHRLPFSLLSDPDHAVAEAYGAWGEKSMYGRKFMGIVRSTFLIGADGRIAAVWPKVKVAGHADEVLAALTQPGAAPQRARPAKKAKPKKASPRAPRR